MRTPVITLAAAGLILLSATGAQPDKTGSFRQIDLPSYKGPFTGVKNPTTITSVKELKEALPDQDLLNQVDFAKEYLLVFRWIGSQDKVRHRLETKGPSV